MPRSPEKISKITATAKGATIVGDTEKGHVVNNHITNNVVYNYNGTSPSPEQSEHADSGNKDTNGKEASPELQKKRREYLERRKEKMKKAVQALIESQKTATGTPPSPEPTPTPAGGDEPAPTPPTPEPTPTPKPEPPVPTPPTPPGGGDPAPVPPGPAPAPVPPSPTKPRNMDEYLAAARRGEITIGGRPWRKEDPALNEVHTPTYRNKHVEHISNGMRRNKKEFERHLANEKAHEALVGKRREAREQLFAEKHGGKEIYERMLEARKKAFAREKDHHAHAILNKLDWKERGRRRAARDEEAKASLEWNKFLQNLSDVSPREKLEALVLRKRSTILGANELYTNARAEAMSDRDKTLFGKVLKTPGYIAKGYLGITGWMGKSLANIGSSKLDSRALERRQEKFTRNVRILTGAALGTAVGSIFAPVSVAAAGGALGYGAFLTFRSIMGVTVGGIAGKGAGKLNKMTWDAHSRDKFKDEVRNTDVETVEDQKKQRKAAAWGNRNARKKRAALIEGGTAFVVGGLTSFGINEAFHNLPSVQHAWHDTFEGKVPGGHVGVIPPHHGLAHGPAAQPPALHSPSGAKLQLGIGEKMANGKVIDDADKLFAHFGLQLQQEVPGHYAAVDTYLKLLKPEAANHMLGHEDHFSQNFGFETKDHPPLSELMKKDDTIMLNNKHQIVINWADQTRPQHVLIDEKGLPNKDLGDLSKYLKPLHGHAAAAAHATHETNADHTAAAPYSGSEVSAPDQGTSAEFHTLAEKVVAARNAEIAAQYNRVVEAQASLNNNTAVDPVTHARLVELYNTEQATYERLTGNTAVIPSADTVPNTAPPQPTSAPQAPTAPQAPVYDAHPQAPARPAAPLDVPPRHAPTEVPAAIPHADILHQNEYRSRPYLDPSEKKQVYLFDGPPGKDFMIKLQEVAAAHPGVEVKYNSPEPTMITGTSQPWVATAKYEPGSGFTIESMPSNPNMAGTQLDPSLFNQPGQ